MLFGVERLHEEGVGDDADVRTEPDELDFVIVRKRCGEGGRAKRRLFEDGGRLPYKGLERLCDLPPRRAADAVLDGELLPLLRPEVVRAVRVHGEDERRPLCACGGELVHEMRQHRLRLGRPERPVDKVILHIYDHDCVLHDVSSFTPQTARHAFPLPLRIESAVPRKSDT